MRKQARQRQALTAIQNDLEAQREGPQQKKGWHSKDMKPLSARTDKQRDALREFAQGQNMGLLGSAGTGKTLLAMSMAFGELLRPGSDIKQVMLVRTTAQSREQGFLPGSIEEKEAPFTNVYKDKLAYLFGRDRTYEDMQAAGKLKFMSSSFQRGESWDNTIVIFDEAQNANWEEINTAITRLGDNSRIIIVGDTNQCDLSGRGIDISGLNLFETVAQHMDVFSLIRFEIADVVRSQFVKDWLYAVKRHIDAQAIRDRRDTSSRPFQGRPSGGDEYAGVRRA